jgi:hypothetical protein
MMKKKWLKRSYIISKVEDIDTMLFMIFTLFSTEVRPATQDITTAGVKTAEVKTAHK